MEHVCHYWSMGLGARVHCTEAENMKCPANSDCTAHLCYFLFSKFCSKAERSESVCVSFADTGLEVVHKNKEERERGEACVCVEGGRKGWREKGR